MAFIRAKLRQVDTIKYETAPLSINSVLVLIPMIQVITSFRRIKVPSKAGRVKEASFFVDTARARHMASEENDANYLKKLKKVLKLKLSKGESKEALVKALKAITPCLADCTQTTVSSFQEDFNTLAESLADPFILKSKSKEIKQLSATCIAEILRLFAPNPPYDDSQLKDIFASFIEQLAGLGGDQASPSYQKYFYLLESLSRINSCVVLVERELWTTLVQLFRLFFEMSEHELSSRIEFHMLDILAQCLAECQHIPSQLLDCILVRLTSPSKDEKPKAKALALKLLSRCENELARPVNAFLEETLVRERESDDELSTTIVERKDQLSILEQICISQPQLLLQTVPKLQTMITYEDEDKRIEVADMLTRVFRDEANTMAQKFESVFEAYMGRHKDTSPKVRCIIVEATEHLLQVFPDPNSKQHHIIAGALELKVFDPVDKVRLAAVSSICAAAAKNPGCVTLSLLNKVGKRTLDKKDLVRNKAMVGLATVFRKHVSMYWKDAKALPNTSKNFVWIPRRIIPCASLSTDMGSQVEALFDEQFLPSKASAEQRLRCLMGIFSNLDERCKEWFRKVIATKQRLQARVLELLNSAETLAEDDSVGNERQYKLALFLVRAVAPLADQQDAQRAKDVEVKRVKALFKIVKHKDRNVGRWLRTLCDPSTGFDKLRTVQSELLRVLRITKSGNKEKEKHLEAVAQGLVSRIALTTISGNSTEILLNMVEEKLENKMVILCKSGLDILLEIARSFPSLMSGKSVVASLARLLDSDDPDVHGLALKVLAEAQAQASTELPKNAAKQLATRLQTLATKSPKAGPEENDSCALMQIKNSIRAIAKLFPEEQASTLLTPVLKEHAKHLNLKSNAHTLGRVLQVYSEVAQSAPKHLEPEVSKVMSFLLEQLLPAVNGPIMGLAFELLRNLLLCSLVEGKDLPELARPALTFCLKVLQLEGNLTGMEDETVSAEEEARRGHLVLGATDTLLNLCTDAKFSRMLMLPPSKTSKTKPASSFHFATLAMVAHSEVKEVRDQFVSSLLKLLIDKKLPLMPWAAIICLCASDQSAERTKNQHTLNQLISRHRLMVTQGLGEKVPEYLLADLIYMLSYHPDFSDGMPDSSDTQANFSEQDKEDATEVYEYFTNILSFLIRALCEKQENNYNLMMQLTTAIKEHEDLAELSRLELKKLGQNKNWGQEHPGQFALDDKMYAPRDNKARKLARAYLPDWYVQQATVSPKKGRQAVRKEAKEAKEAVSPAKKKQQQQPKPETKPAKKPTAAKAKKEKETQPLPEPERQRPKLSRNAKLVTPNKGNLSEKEFEELLEANEASPAPSRKRKEAPSPYEYSAGTANGKDDNEEEEEEQEPEDQEEDEYEPNSKRRKQSPIKTSSKRQKKTVVQEQNGKGAFDKDEEETHESPKKANKKKTPKKNETDNEDAYDSPKKQPYKTTPKKQADTEETEEKPKKESKKKTTPKRKNAEGEETDSNTSAKKKNKASGTFKTSRIHRR
eukprot:g27662.t1